MRRKTPSHGLLVMVMSDSLPKSPLGEITWVGVFLDFD